ncbi:hypothetical protein ACLOJK_016436 [Asimina triloba]
MRHEDECSNRSLDGPSAPPLHGVGGEIDLDVNEVPVFNPSTADSLGSRTIDCEVGLRDQFVRTSISHGSEATAALGSLPRRIPTFNASGYGPWTAVLAYDACVRLCLHAWAKHCMEAPVFLQDECLLLRNAFGLQKTLLQPEEELLAKPPELASEAMVPKPKKTICKMKVQVRKLKMSPDLPSICYFPSLKPSVQKWKSIRCRMCNLQTNLSPHWDTLTKVSVDTRFIKQVSGRRKIRAASPRTSSSNEAVHEAYYCILRLKTSAEEDNVKMKPGSAEAHTFFPESLADDLVIEIHDSKGNCCGHVVAQVAAIASDPSGKLRWWLIYSEPDHELVGRLQLYIDFTTMPDETTPLKCSSVAKTEAYDVVLEAAMKMQHFQQRNLLLHGPWKWLLTEFASHYGVSGAYTRLRYFMMVLVESHMLGEMKEQIQRLLATAFNNYKTLDETAPKGLMDVFRRATGSPAPALMSAVNLYSLLHDIDSLEAQLKLCSYIQVAAKKRARNCLAETDDFVAKSNLPNVTAPIYSAKLLNTLRKFLVACPPTSLSPPVADLAIETANLQRDLNDWNPVKGGVDAKELFHSYIILWIEDKRLSLLKSCKLDRVKWSGEKTQDYTAPFVDEMFERLTEIMNEYEFITGRWPEYTSILENAIADVEMAVVDALEKHYADALSTFKDAIISPKKFGLNYVKKIAAHHTMDPQNIPEELGILLNTMKRLIDVLLPKIENELKSKGSCQPESTRSSTFGERLSEVAVMQRAKFRNYLQAVVEKLSKNTQLRRATKLKRIIQYSKDNVTESEIQNRMQPLKDQLLKTIYLLHRVFEKRLFVTICRGLWVRLGQDVLRLSEDKEIQLRYRSSRITLGILDDTFAYQMKTLLGNVLQEEDLEPPRSIMEARSILGKDALNHKDYN